MAHTSRRPAPQPGRVGLGSRLVDEDQSGLVEPALAPLPPAARQRDIRTALLRCVECLFLYVRPIIPSTQWIAATIQSNPCRCLISSSVASGSLATSAFICSTCSGNSFALCPQNRYLARHLVSNKIGNRMLFGGNLLRQPVYTQLKKDSSDSFRVIGSLDGSDDLMNHALFFGTYPGLTPAMLAYEIEMIQKFIRSKH